MPIAYLQHTQLCVAVLLRLEAMLRLSVCSWNVRIAMTVHQTKHVLILVVWIPVHYQMYVDSMLIVCLLTMLEFVPVSLVSQATLT